MNSLENVTWYRIAPMEVKSGSNLPNPVVRNNNHFSFNNPHLVGLSHVDNIDVSSNYCHVYLCGTGSDPTENNSASWWLETSRNIENIFACIGLSYVWGNMTDSERNKRAVEIATSDNNVQTILENYHLDILFGGNSSGLVDIPVEHCIINRLLDLIIHLKDTRHVNEGWASLLTHLDSDDNHALSTSVSTSKYALNLSRFIFSGHSQGAGHVCYLAKHYPLRKAILISGPQEYITYNDNDSDNDANDCECNSGNNGGTSKSCGSGGISWLSTSNGGHYETTDIVSFMHRDEEDTADLIRQNWGHIRPLHQSTSGAATANIYTEITCDRMTSTHTNDTNNIGYNDMLDVTNAVLSYDLNTSSNVDNLFDNKYKMFITCIPPYTPPVSVVCNSNKQRSLRLCHNSTVVDEYTPRKQQCISNDNKNDDVMSEVIEQPLYTFTIWRHLLLTTAAIKH